MSPTDSQPKESTTSTKPDPSTRRPQVPRQSPSLVSRLVNGIDDVRNLGWAFVETLLSPVLDPSSWTRPPSEITATSSWPTFGMGGNRIGGGGGGGNGGARLGGGGGGAWGGNSGSNNPRPPGQGNGGRRLGGMGTMGGLAGSGGTVDGCRGTCG